MIVQEYGDPTRIYYHAHPKIIGSTEREWIDNLKQDIAGHSEYPVNLIINLTWFDASEKQEIEVISWIESFGSSENIKVWLTGTIDGTDWFKNTQLYKHINQTYCVNIVGFAEDHWYSWIPKLFVNSNIDILESDYYLNQLPKYTYLSYNRKPRNRRVELVKSLIQNSILNNGWVTFERGHFSEIDIVTSETDQDRHTIDLRFSRPEDIFSCGNLNYWRDSYCVIVTETEPTDSYHISEKTWKPIFGMRPFLLNCNTGVTSVLEKLNFYTPKDLFKNSKLDGSLESTIDQLKILCEKTPDELYRMWQSQLPLLNYNRQRIIEISKQDPTRILNWSQIYSVPVSG